MIKQQENGISVERLDYIDGLKGMAAVFVVFCHLACVFSPGLYFIDQATTKFERVWLQTPLNILTNGNFSVQFFFVVSGFLITKKAYEGRAVSNHLPISNYLKYLKIVLPGILLAALLMFLNAMKHLQAFSIDPTLAFVKDYNNFVPTLTKLICDIFVFVYIKNSVFDGPFWTIKIEFWGGYSLM